MPDDVTPAPGPQPSTDTDHAAAGSHGGHGTSVAAWTASLGVTFGALVVCVAMIFVLYWLIAVGVAVIVVAAVSGPVLARAGYGATRGAREYTGQARAVR